MGVGGGRVDAVYWYLENGIKLYYDLFIAMHTFLSFSFRKSNILSGLGSLISMDKTCREKVMDQDQCHVRTCPSSPALRTI